MRCKKRHDYAGRCQKEVGRNGVHSDGDMYHIGTYRGQSVQWAHDSRSTLFRGDEEEPFATVMNGVFDILKGR